MTRFIGRDGGETIDGNQLSIEKYLEIFAGDGDDTIVGASDYLTLVWGGAGNDHISDARYVWGEEGADVITGGTFVRGGDGDDAIRSEETGIFYGDDGNDEILVLGGKLYGGDGDDRLVIDDAFDQSDNAVLDGGAGNDRLVGSYYGSETLIGGLGADTLTGGGGGGDRFVFRSVAEIGLAAGKHDVITDFGYAEGDANGIIDLSLIDAKTKVAGNNVFSFLAAEDAHFTGKQGQLRWYESKNVLYVEGDVNGDRKADFRLELRGSIDHLDKNDFIL